jgi:hypothetical protein
MAKSSSKTSNKVAVKKKPSAPPLGAGGQRTVTRRRPPIRGAISDRALATLIQPECKDMGELAQQMNNDYQVTLAKTTLLANIAAVKVEIEPTGDDPRARLLADQLKKLWDTHLPEMVDIISDGRVAFEKLWDYNAAANVSFIRKLQALPYAQTEMKLVENTGDFDGIELSYGGDNNKGKGSGAKKLDIPADNSWWLALDATATHPHGKSRYSGAPYVVWKERQTAIRLRKLFIQKLVLMGGVAHVPDELTMENGESIDTFTEMAKAHDERLAGGLMILSNARDGEGNYEFDITESPTTLDPAPLDGHIDGLDQEQLQAFSIPPKVVIEGDAVGSFAMVSMQRLILDAVVEHILKQMESSFQKYIIDKDVEATFQPGSGVKIKIGHKSLLDQQNQIVTKVVEVLLTSPQLPTLLKSGAIDIMQLLEDSRIPLLPGAKEAIEKLLREAMQSAEIGQQLAQQQLEQEQNPPQGDEPGSEESANVNPAGPIPPVDGAPLPIEPPPEDSNFANPYHDPDTGQFTHAGGGGVAASLSAVAGYFGLTTGKHVSIHPSGMIKLKAPKTIADAHGLLGTMEKIHDIATHEHSLALKLPDNHEHRVKAIMRLAHVQAQHTRAIKMAHTVLSKHLAAKGGAAEAAAKVATKITK